MSYDGDALVGQVEEDHRRTQDAAAADDVDVEHVCHANEQEDGDFPHDALKADLARQVLVQYGAEYARDVIYGDKYDQCVEQMVEVAEKLADENADARRPPAKVHKVFHYVFPP